MNYEVKAASVVTADDDGARGAARADSVRADSVRAEDVRADMESLRLEMKQELAAMTRQMAHISQPPLVKDGPGRASAFAEQYLRKGLESGIEVKKLQTGIAADGGLAVPLEIDTRIGSQLALLSPMRQIADVVQVGTANYRKLIATGAVASGWVADGAPRPETATPAFVEVAPPMGELYANPAASQAMLDDAVFDVETWLAGEIAKEFARAESVAFVSGNGVSQPKGFLTYPTEKKDDSTRAWGTIEHVLTGKAGGFAATNPADSLVDMVHALRTPYRQGAAFVMNSNTLGLIRKFKDADGNFIWRPGLAEGEQPTLLGYPVVEVDAMPDVASGSLSVAFGQFSSGYVIVERGETAVLRDPYSNKPFVHFYATRRVGGAVANSEAIKLLKFSAS